MWPIMIYNVRESTVTVNNTAIDYISFGNGSKSLIMIQGLSTRGIKGAGLSLAYMYRIFAKEYKVYLFDRRPDVFNGITIQDMAMDIADAMDAMGIQGADVFGVSQGGMIAQYLAIHRPDLVHKLVLAVTCSKANDTLVSTIDHWINLTQQGSYRDLVTDMAERMYSPKQLRRYRPLIPLLTLLQRPKNPDRFIILAKSCLTCHAFDDLCRIQCPVFVIGSKDDKVVGSNSSLEIAQRLNCEHHIYQGLSHAAYEEAKGFNQHVYDFLMK